MQVLPCSSLLAPRPQLHPLTCISAVSAASSFLPSGLDASLINGQPDAPLARPITQSLVLVSPSTVIYQNEISMHR